MLEIVGDGNSGFPFFRRKYHGNENSHSVIREREWELLYGNGMEMGIENGGNIFAKKLQFQLCKVCTE